MAKQQFLHIRTERIHQQGLDIEEVLSKEMLTELLYEPSRELVWSCVQDGQLKANILPDGNTYRLDGDIDVTLTTPCVRCLNDVVVQLSAKLHMHLMPGVEPSLVDLELDESDDLDEDLRADEPDVGYFQNGVVKLDLIVREQLFLDLPIFPTCEDSGFADNRVCEFTSVMLGPTKDAVWPDPVKEKLAALRKEMV